MEPLPMVGGKGSLPPQFQAKVGGPGSLPPQARQKMKRPPVEQMDGGPGSLPPRFKAQPKIVGGPDTIPDFLKEPAEEEAKEPRAESIPIVAVVNEVLTDINKFVAQLEAASQTTMWEVRFWVDIIKCFRELLDRAQKALDDDPAASKQVEQLCHLVESKIRQYFITIFREPNLRTRKLITQIFSFGNREVTQPIIDFLVNIEDGSSDPEDPDNDHPEIFDSNTILLCEEPGLRGLVCHNIDVTVRRFLVFWLLWLCFFNKNKPHKRTNIPTLFSFLSGLSWKIHGIF